MLIEIIDPDIAMLDRLPPEPVRPSSFDLVLWVAKMRSDLLERVPPGQRNDFGSRVLAGLCMTAQSEARLQ
jgi:hypothetical protein